MSRLHPLRPLFLILTAVVWPGLASASMGVQLETRVRGIELVVHALVGGSGAGTPEKHLGSSLAYDEIAPGYSLAAEGPAAMDTAAIRFTQKSVGQTASAPDVLASSEEGERWGQKLVQDAVSAVKAEGSSKAQKDLAQAAGQQDANSQALGEKVRQQNADIAKDSPHGLAAAVPVVGSARLSLANFKHGEYVGGTFYAVLAISDASAVEGIAAGAGKLLLKAGEKLTLGAAEGASTIDTALVRFSQDSVKGAFRNGTSLSDAAAALRAGGADAAGAYPPIRLFEANGSLFTLDNRRLLVFSEAGMQVPFRMATDAEVAAEVGGAFNKFTTTAEQGFGQFIGVRGGP